jgi:hypothetical protein
MHLHSIVGPLSALFSLGAAAAGVDPATAIRGSLGASLGDFTLSDFSGQLVFLVNAGFALLAGAAALICARRGSPKVAEPTQELQRHAIDL